MPDRWDLINSVFSSVIGREPSERAAFLADACAGDEQLRQDIESMLVAYERASQSLERPMFGGGHSSHAAAASSDLTVSSPPDKGRLLTAWVRGALELPRPARGGWLQSITRAHQELLRDAETLLSIATDITTSEIETAAASGVESTRCTERDDRDRRPAVGQRLAHYDLVGWLGAGGMGEVFRARDTALGRDAALKLIPRRFTRALRVRLLREAEASAKLQHPAIATFYEAGEDGGEAFIAMEFVKGETLRKRLAEGPVPLAQALAITRCLLEALQHAHTAGILHRDIKPENVVITGAGSAKLLDFGLAMPLLSTERGTGLAPLGDVANMTSSRIAGTLGYMAPEQLRREALDARTDVFQVGAVMYELLTGSPAFPGSTPLERIAAVMLRDPDFDVPSVAALPVGIRRILERALSREPEARYPTAAAFLADVEDFGGRAHFDRSGSVAVMDLENLAEDEATAWVATAVAESLRSALSHAPRVTVITRERLFAALRADATSQRAGPVGVGLQLGCDRVVAGSFRSSGSRLRISLELHDVSTGRLTATHQVDGLIDEVIALENTLTDRLLDSLGVPLSRSHRAGPTSVEAHECFARARRLLDGLNKGAVDQARELLHRAVALEPDYAAALSALANAYGFRSIATTDRTDLARAVEFADRAIDVDARNWEAYTWKGYALMRQSRFEEAAEAYRRATELNPAHAPAPYFAGSSLLFVGRIADAVPLLQRAVDLDPRLGMPWLGLGAAHLSLGLLAEARYSFERARTLEGEAVRFETAGADAYVADVLRAEGHLDEARTRVLSGLQAVERSDHAYRDTFRAYALVVLGQTALEQRDFEAARAAYGQVLAQAHGRPRTRSCGQLVVRAKVGLAAASGSVELYEQAAHLYDERSSYNFEPFFGALDHQTLFALAGVAQLLGRSGEMTEFLARAQRVGETRVVAST
jgi:tetratricopeptide (TPR) repeat protein/TolB-like protein/predicted Ser/Thr protein kinase